LEKTKKIGIIGGSGLYKIDGLCDVEEIEISTPFGQTSDVFFKGTIGDVTLYFVPRHARSHSLSPSEINSRANIYALKKLGIKVLISISAVGSMREEIAPGDIVLVDQFIDFTKGKRNSTFFENGIVGHVPLGKPVCDTLKEILFDVSKNITKTHLNGTYVTIEGPQFSTKAESNMFRSLGVDVIGMTASPEYKLAREAEIHYAVIALSTDYDCWKEDEKDVNVEEVIKTLNLNVSKAKEIIKKSVPSISKNWENISKCNCENALQNAVMTSKESIKTDVYEKLKLLISKYI
jgi:5'-methylthioadenosine phosphorylase